MNASGFTVERLWQTRSIVLGKIVGWWPWVVDLARATAGDKYVIIASPEENYCWWDTSELCTSCSDVSQSYTIAFNTTNVHKLAIGHLMQA